MMRGNHNFMPRMVIPALMASMVCWCTVWAEPPLAVLESYEAAKDYFSDLYETDLERFLEEFQYLDESIADRVDDYVWNKHNDFDLSSWTVEEAPPDSSAPDNELTFTDPDVSENPAPLTSEEQHPLDLIQGEDAEQMAALEQLWQDNATQAAEIEAKADAWVAEHKWDSRPDLQGTHKRVFVSYDPYGLPERIEVHYSWLGDQAAFIGSFDGNGDLREDLHITPWGRAYINAKAHLPDNLTSSDMRFVVGRDRDGNYYLARVHYGTMQGNIRFNMDGDTYWGERFDQNGRRDLSLHYPQNYPVFTDPAGDLALLPLHRLIVSDCEPCAELVRKHNEMVASANDMAHWINLDATHHNRLNKLAERNNVYTVDPDLVYIDGCDSAFPSMFLLRDRYEVWAGKWQELVEQISSLRGELSNCVMQCGAHQGAGDETLDEAQEEVLQSEAPAEDVAETDPAQEDETAPAGEITQEEPAGLPSSTTESVDTVTDPDLAEWSSPPLNALPEGNGDLADLLERLQMLRGISQMCLSYECPDVDCDAAAARLRTLRQIEALLDLMVINLSELYAKAQEHHQNLLFESNLSFELMQQRQEAIHINRTLTAIGSALLDLASVLDFLGSLEDLGKESAAKQIDGVYEFFKDLESTVGGLLTELELVSSYDGLTSSILPGVMDYLATAGILPTGTTFEGFKDKINDIKSWSSDLVDYIETAGSIKKSLSGIEPEKLNDLLNGLKGSLLSTLGDVVKEGSNLLHEQLQSQLAAAQSALVGSNLAAEKFYQELLDIQMRLAAARSALQETRPTLKMVDACMSRDCGMSTLTAPRIQIPGAEDGVYVRLTWLNQQLAMFTGQLTPYEVVDRICPDDHSNALHQAGLDCPECREQADKVERLGDRLLQLQSDHVPLEEQAERAAQIKDVQRRYEEASYELELCLQLRCGDTAVIPEELGLVMPAGTEFLSQGIYGVANNCPPCEPLADMLRQLLYSEEQFRKAISYLNYRAAQLPGLRQSLLEAQAEFDIKRRNLDARIANLAGENSVLDWAVATLHNEDRIEFIEAEAELAQLANEIGRLIRDIENIESALQELPVLQEKLATIRERIEYIWSELAYCQKTHCSLEADAQAVADLFNDEGPGISGASPPPLVPPTPVPAGGSTPPPPPAPPPSGSAGTDTEENADDLSDVQEPVGEQTTDDTTSGDLPSDTQAQEAGLDVAKGGLLLVNHAGDPVGGEVLWIPDDPMEEQADPQEFTDGALPEELDFAFTTPGRFIINPICHAPMVINTGPGTPLGSGEDVTATATRSPLRAVTSCNAKESEVFQSIADHYNVSQPQYEGRGVEVELEGKTWWFWLPETSACSAGQTDLGGTWQATDLDVGVNGNCDQSTAWGSCGGQDVLITRTECPAAQTEFYSVPVLGTRQPVVDGQCEFSLYNYEDQDQSEVPPMCAGVTSPNPVQCLDSTCSSWMEFEQAIFPKLDLNDPLASSRGSWGQKYSDQWWLRAIGAITQDGQSQLPKRATEVLVGVLDSGVDIAHEDLRNQIWVNKGEIAGNGIDDDENGYIDDSRGWNFSGDNPNVEDVFGHGTAVAGIIGAESGNGVGIAGTNPWARILPVKIGRYDGLASNIRLAKAIRYAVDQGAKVLNISYGAAGRSRIVELAVEYANQRNAVVVAASGNEGSETSDVFPAGIEQVLSVGASDLDGERLPFSNWGAKVPLVAPGTDILTLRAKGSDLLRFDREDYQSGLAVVNEAYYRVTGTSFSAPQVTGLASLLLGLNEGIGPADVRRMLVGSATDTGFPGIDQHTGYGVINMEQALSTPVSFELSGHIAGARLAQRGDRYIVEVTGSASADRFRRATLELGRGTAPGKWRQINRLSKPVDMGVLGSIDANDLRGAPEWTLRLRVEHKNGRQREVRFKLSLGG